MVTDTPKKRVLTPEQKERRNAKARENRKNKAIPGLKKNASKTHIVKEPLVVGYVKDRDGVHVTLSNGLTISLDEAILIHDWVEEWRYGSVQFMGYVQNKIVG